METQLIHEAPSDLFVIVRLERLVSEQRDVLFFTYSGYTEP